jgi:hypothetical protein
MIAMGGVFRWGESKAETLDYSVHIGLYISIRLPLELGNWALTQRPTTDGLMLHVLSRNVRTWLLMCIKYKNSIEASIFRKRTAYLREQGSRGMAVVSPDSNTYSSPTSYFRRQVLQSSLATLVYAR